jgi:hypothetical protein
MGISNSNPDLFRAILAMDAYNRGYNAGVKSPAAGGYRGVTGELQGSYRGYRDGIPIAKLLLFAARPELRGQDINCRIITLRGKAGASQPVAS